MDYGEVDRRRTKGDLKKKRLVRGYKMQSIFGVSVFRCFGVSDSIKNYGVFDTHNFSWKLVKIGGFF